MVFLIVISLILALPLILILKDFILAEIEFHYYKRQGMGSPSERSFLFGHALKFAELGERPEEKDFTMNIVSRYEYETKTQKYSYPEAFILKMLSRNIVFICHHDLFQDLLLVKNKYFDKHPHLQQILLPLMGNGLFLAVGDLSWQQQRKSLSQSFYKQKLIQHLDLISEVTDKKIEHIKNNQAKTGKPIDIIGEMSELFMKIVLVCIFNDEEACSECIPYTLHGHTEQLPLEVFLQRCFQEQFTRIKRWAFRLFPILLPYYFTKYDKEVLGNCERIRQFVQVIIDKRREMRKQPGYVPKGDLLDTLLEDELFSNNTQVLIDQCFTFFFAVSQTIFYSTSNVIIYGIQEPKHLDKIREEYIDKIINSTEPFYDKIQNLSYFGMCFYEAMRLEAPVKMSSSVTVNEDCQIGPYFLKKGVQLILGLDIVHRNPEQWQEPEKYLPERFDPHSPLYLTPSGTKRHPYSFCPFLGGSRICLGKTFAETATRVVGPKFIHNFDFELVDQSHYQKKPANHLGVKQIQQCLVKVTNRS